MDMKRVVNGGLSYRAADNLRALGGLLVVLSIIVVFGLIASLFEVGSWTMVHTWGTVTASLLCGLGSALGALGDQAARWHSDSARRARGELP